MGTYGVPPPSFSLGPAPSPAPAGDPAMRDRLRMLGIGGGVGLQNPQQNSMSGISERSMGGMSNADLATPNLDVGRVRAVEAQPNTMMGMARGGDYWGGSGQSPVPSQGSFLDRGSIPGGPTGELGPAMERWKSAGMSMGRGAGGPSNADVASQNIDSGRADYFAQRERALAQSRGQMPMGDPYGSTSAPAPAGPGFAAQAAQRMGSMRPMGSSMGPPPMRPGQSPGFGPPLMGSPGMGRGMGPAMRPPMRPQPMPRPGGGMGGGMGYGGGGGGMGQTTAMPRRPTPPTNSTPSAF